MITTSQMLKKIKRIYKEIFYICHHSVVKYNSHHFHLEECPLPRGSELDTEEYGVWSSQLNSYCGRFFYLHCFPGCRVLHFIMVICSYVMYSYGINYACCTHIKLITLSFMPYTVVDIEVIVHKYHVALLYLHQELGFFT